MRSKSSDDDARKHVHPMEVENESGEVDPEPKEAQAARLGRTVRHDHVIRAASVAIVAVVLGIALVSADTFINAVGALRTFVTQYCSWWIVLCAFLCFAVCIFVAVTKLGSIRLGGKDAKPAFSYFSWFAMLFATGQGVGLVFWAVAEPIMMYGGTPFNAPDPLFAGDTALAWTYFHWAIPAWAIYAIVSLFMAYARYNMHKDTTFRGTVEDLFPARAKRPVGIVVEILVVIATIFGLTTSLGLASYQFNSGIQQIFNIQTGQALQVAFVILFGSIATMSVWFGVVRGIKKISNANAVMSIVFVAAVFIFGPTLYILGVLPESLSVFIDQFMLMSGFTEAVNLGAGIASYGDSWQAFWSFFIFCWCFAFATFTAGFVSTISRGRTLREFVGGVVFVPAGNPVFKKDRPVTPAAERLEMCRIATRSNPAFDVSAIEIERGGDTYTVDTLRQLRAHYPDNVELRFITGADAVYHIVQWRESAAIADLARLIAVTRPGYALSEERRAFIAEHGNFAIDYLEVTALAISSSDLRRRVAAGKSIRYLTMQGVLDYIQERGLYRADPHHEGGVR